MREIKFRAWDKKRNKMYLNIGINHGEVLIDTRWYKKDEIIVMQYTGLKDESNREIYEGDICKINIYLPTGNKFETYLQRTDIYPVIIDGSRFVFQNKKGSGLIGDIEYWTNNQMHNGTYYICNDNCVEIIGNVYENLELIKEID